jgi:WD40 repeat protein
MANIASDPKKTQREIVTPHTKELRCVSLSHNSQFIAVASWDNTLSVFDVKTLQLIHHLKGQSDIVVCVCFSNDDKLIASGSFVTIIIWSVSTGEVTHRLKGHTYWVDYVCFSNDDFYLWSEDFIISKTRVFEVISGKCVSEEKPLWAVKNDNTKGESADGRIKYSLDTDYYRRSGHKIIIEVVENENEESAKSVESKTVAKVCIDWSFFFQKIVRSFLSFASPTQ